MSIEENGNQPSAEGTSQEEMTPEIEECEDAAMEALDFDYENEPGTSHSVNLTFIRGGQVQQAEEVDVVSMWVERAMTTFAHEYGQCILELDFLQAAKKVQSFKAEWFPNKDKELGKKEKMWEIFLTCMAMTLELDFNYYALEFTKQSNKILGSKHKNVIRQKYADIQGTLFNSTKDHQRSFSKGREPRRSHSVEYPIIIPNSPEGALFLGLKEYIDCRMKMIDLYVTTFQNYERFADWNDFLRRVAEYEKLLQKDFVPILRPMIVYFQEELSILKQLIQTHQNISQMQDTVLNLIELRKIRSSIMAWATGFEMPENSPLPIIGRLQKTELAPKFHTALWFLKFYDFLAAKISLYITDHMSPYISGEDLAAMHAQDNMYNFINLFQTFSNSAKPMIVGVVMDRTSFKEDPFFGFSRPNQHVLYSTMKPIPFEGNPALYPYVFRVELSNPDGTRYLSGSHSDSCYADVAEMIEAAKVEFNKNPINPLNPKPHPVYSFGSERDNERNLLCDHIEENLYVVAVFQGSNLNTPQEFTVFVRSLLPVLTGRGLFAEMKKLLSP